MIQKELKIINKLGLHARAAAKLASTANHFGCEIRTAIIDPSRADTPNKLVDAKSVMALMLLAASQGVVLYFEFDGDDEHRADEGITALIAARFDESE